MKKIFGDPQAPIETTIDSGWAGQVEYREIERDTTRTLKLEFEEDAVASNAVCDCCGGGDDDSDSDSGSDSGSDSDGGSDSDSGDSDSGRDSDSGGDRSATAEGDQDTLLGSWSAGADSFKPRLAAMWVETRFPWLSAFFERLGPTTHPAL